MKAYKGAAFLFLMLCLIIIMPSQTFPEVKDTDRLVLMWQVLRNVSDDDLDFLQSKGVNLIQAYAILSWSDEEIRTYLDKAQKHGMGVVMTIKRLLGKNASGFTFNYKKAEPFINKWKDHPAVFAWQAFDEPSNKPARVPKSFQEEVYRFIKRVDPGGRVFLTWNGVRTDDYECCFSENSFDVLDVHKYIIDTISNRQRNQLRNLESYSKDSYPLIITLRAYVGPDRLDIGPDSLREQYDFYFVENNLTRNVGFFGWQLDKNRGINQDPDIMRQFRELKLR